MDYKKIIKNRETREKILRVLSFIPDKQMLELQYRIKTGHKLNLKDPRRFTEKLQWYKLYYKDSLLIRCVDKYEVRSYVEEKGLGDILTKCYGVFEKAEDVDFDSLPQSFVIKDTLGSGGNSVIIVKDKDKLDKAVCLKQMEKWVNTPLKPDGGREWPYYSGKKHRIIIEEYIEPETEEQDEYYKKHGLIDYKFFCFNGRAQFIYAAGNRNVGESVSISFFDRKFTQMPVKREGDNLLGDVKKPDNFDELLETAEKLAEDFPHVRVDLYAPGEKVSFSELTFYNASGYMRYEPDSFDYEAGSYFMLPEKAL